MTTTIPDDVRKALVTFLAESEHDLVDADEAGDLIGDANARLRDDMRDEEATAVCLDLLYELVDALTKVELCGACGQNDPPATHVCDLDPAWELAERTADAYSTDRYVSWHGVCSALLLAGYDERQAEAILRSKWTLWAADESSRPEGGATADDLMAWLGRFAGTPGYDVDDLVTETFGP